MKITENALVLLGVGLAVSPAVAANTVPIATSRVYQVAPEEVLEISLSGYDRDGDKLISQIVSICDKGKFYNLAQVYAVHGKGPKYDETKLISAGNVVVPTISKHNVIFKASAEPMSPGIVCSLKYTVKDKLSTSELGEILIISKTVPSRYVLAGSEFSDGSDGWRISGNGDSGSLPSHERTSFRELNYFIFATDGLLNIDASGKDNSLFYFEAPAKFLGDKKSAYGGALRFHMGSFSGDYNSGNLNSDSDFVVLECSTCNSNAGMRFIYKTSDVSLDANGPKEFSLPLSEKGKWLKDPKNTLKSATAPTQCEFVEMLNGLTRFAILGDHTKWYESTGIDNVYLLAKDVGHRQSPPVKCICANPGTQC